MKAQDFQRFHSSLREQRQNLTDWLSATDSSKRQLRLGPFGDGAVEAHLHVLDTAIQKAEDHTLGHCDVCDGYVDPGRLTMDYTCCVCLEHLSEVERTRLESDLELSAKVQQALLPQTTPDIPGLELAAFSRPASTVGGDYFDFFRFRDASHGLVIGDVMGHGIAASLLMASLQASLRTLAPDYESPARIVERLNYIFGHNVQLTKFVTLFVARYDPEKARLTYTNAGHNPPLLVRADLNSEGPLTWLRPTGAAIGLVEDINYEEKDVYLQPGDLVFFYTDGVTESRSAEREEFGDARLADVLRRNSQLSPPELIMHVRRELETFSRSQLLEDDTSMVAAKHE